MASQPLLVFGITGRMGQSLIAALREGSALHLHGAVASAASLRLGRDAAAEGPATGIKITADCAAALSGSSVAVDFSVGSAVAAHARACSQAGVPLLVGATAFDAAATAELTRAAKSIAVVIAPNTSVGVAALSQLAAQAARALGETYDVEISEAHHRDKRDAPSGTALKLGEMVAEARGVSLREVAVFERHGDGCPAPRRQHRFFGGPGRRHRRRAHGHLRGGRRAFGTDAPDDGPDDLWTGGAAGGRLADWASGRPVRHEGCARTLRRSMDSHRGHR